MKHTTYSEAFKEEALRKVLQRGRRTLGELAQELNMPVATLKGWLRTSKKTLSENAPLAEKPARDWNSAQRLQALLETHFLDAEARNAWCRERGVFAHQLAAWKTALEASDNKPAAHALELRQLKDSLCGLRRELARKDKALSEAAALLVLQKKFQALWEDEGK